MEDNWARQAVSLVDMKIECGFDSKTGVVTIADVIDNDSWRIWTNGDPSQMKDKQVYRDIENPTEEDLEAILENYRWVADRTSLFI